MRHVDIKLPGELTTSPKNRQWRLQRGWTERCRIKATEVGFWWQEVLMYLTRWPIKPLRRAPLFRGDGGEHFVIVLDGVLNEWKSGTFLTRRRCGGGGTVAGRGWVVIISPLWSHPCEQIMAVMSSESKQLLCGKKKKTNSSEIKQMSWVHLQTRATTK